MIKAILFDLDGTLIDTNELILNSFRHAFESVLEMEVCDEEITKMFGTPLKESFGAYTKDKLDEVIVAYREFNKDNHDLMCKRFIGVKRTLKALKDKGIKIGIVTSKRRVMAERGTKLSNIDSFFDVFITPECTEKHKPHKEPVLKALNMLCVKPEEAIMVGDSIYDLQSGKNAKTKTCGVTYTALPLELLKNENPDYFIDEPLDIIKIIEKENSIK